MKSAYTLTALLWSVLTVTAHAAPKPADMQQAAQKLLDEHAHHYQDLEYFSGAALSIAIPGETIRNFYTGKISHDSNSENVSASTLFQIGSITKSFTAVIMLQLEKEKVLKLEDTLGMHLPRYDKWAKVPLHQLLNMTSGLPNYSDTPLLNTVEAKNPAAVWSNESLIEFVYPKDSFSPPLKSGYFYSNTGYVLMDMMISTLTKHSYKDELLARTVQAADLNNTFYPVPAADKLIKQRMAHGYNYNQYDNPALVGVDLINNNLSWAGAAGALVSNTEDITKWVQALFIGDKILNAEQKRKMMTIVSVKTGQPINKTSVDDVQAFGLGVAQIYNKENPKELMWFYEGETLGFRAIYIYVPCNKVVISCAFNSATNSENDHSHELVVGVYNLAIKQHPSLRCH